MHPIVKIDSREPSTMELEINHQAGKFIVFIVLLKEQT